MFAVFEKEMLVSVLMGICALGGILSRLALGILYQKMIWETDNMATTNHPQLRQCKLKFSNCYQLNNGVSNIPVFVDKFIHKLSTKWISYRGLYLLSTQLVLLSVVCAGVGVCRSIVAGRSVLQLLPFYVVSFGVLYVYFTVAAIVDISGKKRILRINLVDYLENHLSSQIRVTKKDIHMLYGEEYTDGQRNTGERQNAETEPREVLPRVELFTGDEAWELENLLSDLL